MKSLQQRSVTLMVFLLYTFDIWILLSNSRGRHICLPWCKQIQFSLAFPPFYVDLAFFPLLVCDLSFWKRGRAEAQHNLIHLQPLGLLLPSLFSQPLKGESGYDCLCRADGPSTTAEQCSNAGSVLTGSSWHWRAPLQHWSRCLCHKKSS